MAHVNRFKGVTRMEDMDPSPMAAPPWMTIHACFCDMARMKKGLVDRRQPHGSRVQAETGLRTQLMSTRNTTAPKLGNEPGMYYSC